MQSWRMKSQWWKSKKYWKSGETVHARNIFGEIWKTTKSHDVQGRITSRDSRDGQHGIVRAGTDIQNRPMSFFLPAPSRGAQILWLCLRPDEDTINSIKARFQALIAPHYLARVNRSRGKKHGESQWQKDHWKAMDAKKGANKRDKDTTILIRWQEDGEYRISQWSHGWTENYCRYLDYFTTIDISDFAPDHQRYRYENTITMKCNDTNRNAGPMKARTDYQLTTKVLEGLREEQGRQNSFIQKNERTRQRPFNEELQAKLEWLNRNWKIYFSQTSSSSSSSQNMWQHEPQDSQGR